MITLIKKLFIKNYQDTENKEVRFKYGIVAGAFGIITNLIAAIIKIIIGIISGSIAIIGDAVNNISDTASSVTTLVGFKISSIPADKDHPYGHARFEYVASLIISTVMLMVGVIIAKTSIEKIITPVDISINYITYIVLGFSILLKLSQMALYISFGKSVNSEALKTAGVDSRNDIISTIAIIISAIVFNATGVNIDGYAGLLVALFIVISSILLLKDSINPLLGQKPDKELVKKIKDKLLSYEGVEGLHDLMIHDYGINTAFVVVHVEVLSTSDFVDSHDLIDRIEREFEEDLGMHLVVHLDPIITDDEEVVAHRDRCINILKNINPDLSLHDFRMVKGPTHTNIIFDAVVPFECKMNKASLTEIFTKEYANEETKFFFVIEIDRP
ncbi:MAG TPA: cation diffusion facilitator family transporter [Clostridia bacterium]|jgi:cation diffusion facilitator family transporter|nr:cation diffusion facilitator family transporter [Clostridia bacterium]